MNVQFPDEFLTKTKKGSIELRIFLRRGKFVEYTYMNQKTKKLTKKRKIVLKSEDKDEAYFIIPMKQKGKYLMIKEESVGNVKLWNKGKVINLWR